MGFRLVKPGMLEMMLFSMSLVYQVRAGLQVQSLRKFLLHPLALRCRIKAREKGKTMRVFEIDGHEFEASTREAAVAEYVELYGTQPETVEEIDVPEWGEDYDDEPEFYTDLYPEPLDMPSYAS